ncbi:hypothetical protein IFR04_008331 [Cadophora malorum]|uniref:Uncharacterized protein n=1 Tax=Cadophora malorum TaxID=108018 RepID=A0A8H7WA02_9HELO|nr:hypothetical protein IFR04_008331 [Cadophora malorum]
MARSISPTRINTAMSAVAINHKRFSTSTESSDSFSTHQREAVEAKLYYMRDVCDPEEFQMLVDQELERANMKTTHSTDDKTIQNVAEKVKNKLKKIICVRIAH